MSIKGRLAAMAAAGVAAAASAASAQDYNAMNAQFNAQLNAAMARTQQGIVQSNLNNPQIMAMYQQYRARGGQMSPQQFAYAYGATAGFTPQGMANYNATTRQIQQRDAAAMADYRQAQANRAAAQQAYMNSVQANNQEFGRVLQGQQTYYDPANGSNIVLPYIPPNQPYYDASSGRTYVMTGNGQYMSSNGNGNGYWTQVGPAPRSPQ